jgi:hypothetical protein
MSSLQTCRWRGRPAQSYRHAECSGASRLDLRGCCARKRLQYSIVKDPWAVFPSTFRRERPVPGATFRHFFRFECKSCQADKRVTQPLGMPLSRCGPWPNRRSQKVENRLYSHWTNARAPAKEDQTQAPHGQNKCPIPHRPIANRPQVFNLPHNTAEPQPIGRPGFHVLEPGRLESRLQAGLPAPHTVQRFSGLVVQATRCASIRICRSR